MQPGRARPAALDLLGWLGDDEVARLRAGASSAIPLYPPATATGPVEQTRRLCQAAVDSHCDGALLNLDLARPDNLAVVGHLLG